MRCDFCSEYKSMIFVIYFSSHLFSADELESIGDLSVDQLTVMYFLKVINLFEQFGYHDHVIELAQTAIAICDENDQNRVSAITV